MLLEISRTWKMLAEQAEGTSEPRSKENKSKDTVRRGNGRPPE